MAWIETISDADADGPLKEQFDAAIRRAGRVYNIVRIMSLNPSAMRASMDLYRTLMFSRSPLSRAQRELLAVVVSATTTCDY